MLLPALLIALAASSTPAIHALGLEVEMGEDGVEVVRVVEGSRAAQAGLHPGDRIISVGRVEIASIEGLESALQASEEPLEIEAEAGRRARMRIAFVAQGREVFGDEDTRSSWLGLLGTVELAGPFSALAGFGYSAIGLQPGTGSDAWTPLAGIELKMPFRFDPRIVPIARVLGGPNFVWHQFPFATDHGRKTWDVERVTLEGQAGVRLWFAEVMATVGLGPGKGINAGLAVSFALPL